MENKVIEIIQQPSYWVEEVNNLMYDAMVNYMDKHQLNRTDFAAYLNISKGRLSQILNSGEINFSLEKLFSIALKIGKIPNIKFEDTIDYIKEVENVHKKQYDAFYSENVDEFEVFRFKKEDTKIIQFPIAAHTQNEYSIAY